jgi:hypothetical protein
MMNARRWIFVFALTVLAGPAFAQQPTAAAGRDQAGVGSGLRGPGRQQRAGDGWPGGLRVRQSPHRERRRLGVTLKDDTRVSLGPGSEVRLNSFLFTPAEGRLGLVLNFVRGMAVYVSGKIAKLAPDSIRLETPWAIVGVRGTTVAVQVVQ